MKPVPVFALDVEIACNRKLAAQNARDMRNFKREGLTSMANWFEGRYTAYKNCADSLSKLIETFSE